MTSPFRYRPAPDADVDHDGEIPDWEDNWLSNAFAWASTVFVPTWCQNEQHWTGRFAAFLWTSCPCCALFRGITLGILLGNATWLMFMLVWLSVR